MDVDEHVIERHNLVITHLLFSLSIFFTDCTCQNNATYFVLLLFIERRGKDSWYVPHCQMAYILFGALSSLTDQFNHCVILGFDPHVIPQLPQLFDLPYFSIFCINYTPPKPFPFNSKISITMSWKCLITCSVQEFTYYIYGKVRAFIFTLGITLAPLEVFVSVLYLCILVE